MTDFAPASPSPSSSPDPLTDPVAVDPQSLAGARVAPRSRSARALNIALGAAVVVAIAGVAFAVGRTTAPAAQAGLGLANPGGTFFNGQPGSGNQGGGPGAFGPGGGRLSIEGTVTAVDADSMTVKTASGAEIEISTNGDTTYHQQAAAAAGDVTTGSTVVVQVNDFRGRGGQGVGPGASAAPSGAAVTGPAATDVTVVP